MKQMESNKRLKYENNQPFSISFYSPENYGLLGYEILKAMGL